MTVEKLGREVGNLYNIFWYLMYIYIIVYISYNIVVVAV